MLEKLKIALFIEMHTSTLDYFDDAVYLTLSNDPRRLHYQAGEYAEAIVNCSLKLFWESYACAVSTSEKRGHSTVMISINCAEFSGKFELKLVDEKQGYANWSPELEQHITNVSEQMRKELADMLYNLATEYYHGNARKVGVHYAFSNRY